MKPFRSSVFGALGLALGAATSVSLVACGGESSVAADAGAIGDATQAVDAAEAEPDARPEITYEGHVVDVQLGQTHTCALLEVGRVRCWGKNVSGQLGYGHTEAIGDDESPASAGDVDVGGTVVQLALGQSHTCALLDTKRVRCWGKNENRELGYDHLETIGDDETPASAGDVDVGGDVLAIVAGIRSTCALLDGGGVKCWGDGFFGMLGNATDVRISEAPHALDEIDLGGPARLISASNGHTCALLEAGGVRCWGLGEFGALGYGSTQRVGDNEVPASMGDVSVGGSSPVQDVRAGDRVTCAQLVDGSLHCWGYGAGTGHVLPEVGDIGDDELPSSVDALDVGGPVAQVAAGGSEVGSMVCAVLESGGLRCWGTGILGYAGMEPGNTPPSGYGDLEIGYPVSAVRVGGRSACVLLERGSARCWGDGLVGVLGDGRYEVIGDDETLSSMLDACIEGFEESCP